MKHPRWCLKFISPSEIHSVVQAVRSAEAGTTGEIVPMIVRRSTALGHLGMQIFTLLCLLAVVIYATMHRLGFGDSAAWAAMVLVVLFWPVSEALSHWTLLQRAFTIPAEREWQVHARATLEFFASGFQKTQGHTGVLIFLSLMERKCIVLADEGIAAKLPDDTWQGIVATIVEGIQSGKPAHGLIKGIEDCGKILKDHFPMAGQHKNQLSDDLIIKE